MRTERDRDAHARPGDHHHGRRGQQRRQPPAPRPSATEPPVLQLVAAWHPYCSPPGPAGRSVLVREPDRDVLNGDGARRLGRDPVQHLGKPLFFDSSVLGVSHCATPPVISSASPGASRNRASALAAWLFTAPTEQPMASAVCASVWSAKYLSTTTARCLGGSRSSAAVSAVRESTCANTSP